MTHAGARCLVALLVLPLLGGCFHRRATRPNAPSTSTPESPARSGRYAEDRDSGPAAPPDISKIPEPVPKAEPYSAYGNKSPYSVLGKTYRVLPTAKGYVERGIASWYGNKFHGYTTSDFERYDMYAYSAASKVLPIPCYARVTSLENGRSAIVRVNDRGPFAENRIIDLSYVAAVKLGVWPKGTAMVEVRAIDPARLDQGRPDQGRPDRSGRERRAEPARDAAVTSRSTTTSLPGKTPKPTLYLQVGAYAGAANAERAAAKVRAAKLGEVEIVEAKVNGATLHRVRLGPLKDVDEADRLTPKLRALGLGEPRVAVDN